MSMILVSNIPNGWSFANVKTKFAPALRCPFKPMQFTQATKRGKGCYVKLPENVDPKSMVKSINTFKIGGLHFRATVLNEQEKREIPKPGKKAKKKEPLHKIYYIALMELMAELERKYTGLTKLNAGTNNQLMKKIAWTIFERIEKVLKINEQASENSFHLTRCYRRAHPHFADFQLVLSNLHAIEDAEGKPRTQVNECDIMKFAGRPVSTNVPKENLSESIAKYSNLITKKIDEHISSLVVEESPDDNEEMKAKKRVRAALIKCNPYISSIISQILRKNLETPGGKLDKSKFVIYGEPSLPLKQHTLSFISQYGASDVARSKTNSNMIVFNVPNKQYIPLSDRDSTVLHGVKLIIRPLKRTTFRANEELKTAIVTKCRELDGVSNKN